MTDFMDLMIVGARKTGPVVMHVQLHTSDSASTAWDIHTPMVHAMKSSDTSVICHLPELGWARLWQKHTPRASPSNPAREWLAVLFASPAPPGNIT